MYLNFAPQRIELALTDKLAQFPFPFAWLSVSFLFLLLDHLVIKREYLFDERIRKFTSMVFFLTAIHTFLFCINTLVEDSHEKGTWFRFLSMTYIYVPILAAIYVYLITDSITKFNLLLKIFFLIICGQVIVGFLMLLFPSYLVDLMGWEGTEYSSAIRSYSSIIGGTGPLGFLFLISLPLCLFYYMQRGTSYLILLGVLLVSLLLTYSRGPLLIAFLYIITMCLTMLIRYPGTYAYKKFFALMILATVIVVISVTGILQLDRDYLLRSDLGDADSARIESTQTALTLAANKPILGYGPGELYIRHYEQSEEKHISLFGKYSLKTPHNLYLLLAAENGFIFLILWVVFLSIPIKLISSGNNKPLAHKLLSMSFVSLIILAYIYSIFSDQLVTQYRMTPTFWFLVGLGMAFSKLTSQADLMQ
jgi:hypothetical protein